MSMKGPKNRIRSLSIAQFEQFKSSKYNTWGQFYVVKTHFLIEDLANFIKERGNMIDYEEQDV